MLQHLERANFQAAVWKHYLESEPEIPSPINHGWIVDGDNLDIHWMTGSPVPASVLELMKCQCRRVCDNRNCPCVANGLKCTQMCSLQNCTNQREEDDELIEADYENDEDLTDYESREYFVKVIIMVLIISNL